MEQERSRAMEEYIAFDSHKRYTWVEHQQANTGKTRGYRVEHAPGAIRQALAGCAPGTPVAIEATANWYWIVDEIEQARCVPRLTHARKAKLMMGQINKTDQLDTHGMNILQRNGTLPTVWIPPGPLRELRELTRTRVVLVAQRTRWKNRITATLARKGHSKAIGAVARHLAEAAFHVLSRPQVYRDPAATTGRTSEV
jgi:transposase